MDTTVVERFERAVRNDARYPMEAYEFLQRGLEFTATKTHGECGSDAENQNRHVSGQQLCEGLRVLAIRSWGPLARLVLERWQIRSTRDFGEMVFMLIRLQLMGRQESDTIEDFDHVYDFEQAFGRYQIPLKPLGR